MYTLRNTLQKQNVYPDALTVIGFKSEYCDFYVIVYLTNEIDNKLKIWKLMKSAELDKSITCSTDLSSDYEKY